MRLLLAVAAGQLELVLQRPLLAGVVAYERLHLALRGPMQHLALGHIVRLRLAVPVAAVAGALAVTQVLRHVQHAAVVHEPGGRVLAAEVVIQSHEAAAEGVVGHRERVEHLLLLLQSETVGGGGLWLLVLRRMLQFRHGRGAGDGFVSAGIDAKLPQLLLEAAVPEILDLVVRPAGQMRCDLRPPALISFDSYDQATGRLAR